MSGENVDGNNQCRGYGVNLRRPVTVLNRHLPEQEMMSHLILDAVLESAGFIQSAWG